jgi:tetratricopeptide (TPR) repeat protein
MLNNPFKSKVLCINQITLLFSRLKDARGQIATLEATVQKMLDKLNYAVNCLLTRGKLLYQTNQHQQAIEHYKKAIEYETMGRNDQQILGYIYHDIMLAYRKLNR